MVIFCGNVCKYCQVLSPNIIPIITGLKMISYDILRLNPLSMKSKTYFMNWTEGHDIEKK